MCEEWRSVEGWPYEVSNIGRVRRTKPASGTTVGRILGDQQCWGYAGVLLRDGPGHKWWAQIHRLVASAWHGPPPHSKSVVNHLNGDSTDNRPENLEWTDRAGNNAHAAKMGLCAKGEAHGMAKLTKDEVRAIRSQYVPYHVPARLLAEQYGVSEGAISCIVTGRNWGWLI